jgi:hypothetical protein
MGALLYSWDDFILFILSDEAVIVKVRVLIDKFEKIK